MDKETEDNFLYAMEQVENGSPLKDFLDEDDVIEALAMLEGIIRRRREPPKIDFPKKERALEKLDKLIRYDEEQYCCGMRETHFGEYVMYDSVRRLIESL